MCPWVGPHAPSFGLQLLGLPSRVEYLSPQGVLLPLVYGTIASPLWLELRGRSAGQMTPSWTVYRRACHRLLPWLRVTFAMVPDAAWPGSDQWPWGTAPATGPVGRLGCLGRPSVSDPWGVGSFLSLCRPTCVRCPGPLGSCSPVCLLGALRCVCGVQGHLAPVHRCARSVRSFAFAVSWATWLLFTGVLAWFVMLRVRCPGPLDFCSPVRPLGVLCCVWGVLGHLAPVHRCVRLVCSFVCAVSWAIWLLFTGVPARCVALHLRCPGPLGSCSPLRPFGALLCLCGVLGHLAPAHPCARMVCRVVCAVSWATWLLFSGAPARCVVLCVGCPGSLGSCSAVCPLGLLLCVCGVLGHLAPFHRCAWPWCPIPLLCLVLVRARCPGPVAPVHWCARCVRCACAVGGCVSLPPPLIFFFVPSLPFFSFSGKKRQRRGRAYTAGTSMGDWCSGEIVSCSLASDVGALAAAPQGCGLRLLMYTGMGQGGFR